MKKLSLKIKILHQHGIKIILKDGRIIAVSYGSHNDIPIEEHTDITDFSMYDLLKYLGY